MKAATRETCNMRHIWEGRELGLPSNSLNSKRAEIARHQLLRKSPSWTAPASTHLAGSRQQRHSSQPRGHAQAVTHAQALASQRPTSSRTWHFCPEKSMYISIFFTEQCRKCGGNESRILLQEGLEELCQSPQHEG